MYLYSRTDPRCCHEACRFRLTETMTVHLRSSHFVFREQAQEATARLGEMRKLYVQVAEWDRAPHERVVPPGWDSDLHYACQRPPGRPTSRTFFVFSFHSLLCALSIPSTSVLPARVAVLRPQR